MNKFAPAGISWLKFAPGCPALSAMGATLALAIAASSALAP
jgi:hypothetical protein